MSRRLGIDWKALVLLTCLLLAALVAGIRLDGLPRWAVLALLAAAAATVIVDLRKRLRGDGPLNQMVDILRTAEALQLDLSRSLPEQDGQGDRSLAQTFNQFVQRLRGIFEDLQQHSAVIGLTAAQSRQLSEQAARDARKQEEVSELIYRSSEETARALQMVSERTSSLAETNSANLEAAHRSLVELRDVSGQVTAITNTLREFERTIAQLVTNSEDIGNILATVQAFATQTNMLALNAAIEAARAGEHGRGFAVVADEVRTLAGKVRSAAEQVQTLLSNMSGTVTATASSTSQLIDQADAAQGAINNAAHQFERMVGDFGRNHQSLLEVSSSIEELSVSNDQTRQHSMEVRDLGQRIGKEMQRAFRLADTLRDTSNLSLQGLSRFRIGRGELEPIWDLLIQRRDAIQAEMEKLLDRGVDLFDRNYQPHPKSKHHVVVSYLQPLRDACQRMIDELCAADRQHVIFYVLNDDRGLAALLNSHSSQPPTGDLREDAVKSIAGMITVTNPVEIENLRKATHISMGSWVMVDGKSILVAFAPITLYGRRWGSMVCGITPKRLGLEHVLAR